MEIEPIFSLDFEREDEDEKKFDSICRFYDKYVGFLKHLDKCFYVFFLRRM